MNALLKPVNQPPRLDLRAPPPNSDSLATVRIHYVGLCRTDLRVAAGELQVDRALVLGHECSGLIEHDPSGTFRPGDAVAINPLLPGEQFLGLHCDGALQEFLQICPTQLVRAEGIPLQLAAYLEPVAASMAVLKARITPEEKGVIFHANRISHLTFLILRSLGYDIEWMPSPPPEDIHDKFDYAIETVFDEAPILAMMRVLKQGGLLVVKSRQYRPTPVVPGLMVAKELTLQAVNYYNFTSAMNWLRSHQGIVAPLLGETFPLAQWEAAFAAAALGDAKKIFVSLR